MPFSWTCPTTEQELVAALQVGRNHQATVWSDRRPAHPPLLALEALHAGGRLDMAEAQFDACFWVAITCHRVEAPVSMSRPADEDGDVVPFGEPVDPSDIPDRAVVRDPTTPRLFEVEGIGAARSWVSITFGNYVFPPERLFDGLPSHPSSIAFAVPELLQLAEQRFRCTLRQSCTWG